MIPISSLILCYLSLSPNVFLLVLLLLHVILPYVSHVSFLLILMMIVIKSILPGHLLADDVLPCYHLLADDVFCLFQLFKLIIVVDC